MSGGDGSRNVWALVAAGLVAVVVVAALVFVASVTPLLGSPSDGGVPSGSGGGGSAPSPTPTAAGGDTPTATTPTITLPPPDDGERVLLSEPFDDERALENWTVRTNGTVGRDAGVRVVDGELRLRVFRCHEAIAERRFATDADRIRVSFAWRTAAEEWYEYPDWRLLAPNGSARNDTFVAGQVDPGGRETTEPVPVVSVRASRGFKPPGPKGRVWTASRSASVSWTRPSAGERRRGASCCCPARPGPVRASSSTRAR